MRDCSVGVRERNPGDSGTIKPEKAVRKESLQETLTAGVKRFAHSMHIAYNAAEGMQQEKRGEP